MRNVDERGAQLLVQLDDLGAHRGTQLGVQVGKGLVEQEHGRVTHHGAAQGNTLALAAGQSLRLAVEQMLDVQHAGGFTHALVDLVLRGLAQLKAESHVLVNRHVRIQSIVLEHHRDIAVLRGNVIHQAVTDVQLALGDLLQAGDHAQRGGFTAAGRADENDKLFVFDLKVEIGNGGHVARINLVDAFQANACHRNQPPYSSIILDFVDILDGWFRL